MSVSITGHRDLGRDASNDHIGNTIARVLKRIHERAQSVAPDTQCRFLSALATGADQIGAQAALSDTAHAGDSRPWLLHAILPFAKPDYAKGLDDGLARSEESNGEPTSAARFSELLERADRVFELADWRTDKPDDAEAQYWSRQRLRTLGEILVCQADIMIAVWRGTPPAGMGGTADVVRIALDNGVPVVRIDPDTQQVSVLMPETTTLDPVRLALREVTAQDDEMDKLLDEVERVLSRPKKLPGPKASPFESLSYFLQESEHDKKTETTRNTTRWWFYAWFINLFLFDPRKKEKWKALLPRKPRVDYLRTDWDRDPPLSIDHTDAVDETLGPAMLSADAVATARGHVYRSSYIITFLGTVIAVWIGLAGLFSPYHKSYFVGAELLLLTFLIVFYLISSKRALHQRWLNARHVAESMRGARSRAWLGLAGRRAVDSDAPWSAWLSNAAVANASIPNALIDASMLRKLSEKIRWQVDYQRQYHANNHAKLHKLHHRLDVVGWCCLGIAILFGAVYLGVFDPFGAYGKDWWSKETSKLAKYAVTAGCAGMPILAAALTGIRYQGDFERFAKRSQDTEKALGGILERLTQLDHRLDAALKPNAPALPVPAFEELAEIVVELGRVYEADLSDWRYVYSARPSPGLG